MRKLAIGYPWSSPFMYTAFVDAALNMESPEGYETKWFRGDGWCPARRHNDLCEKAVAWGADTICIVGSDQVHPPDMLERLLSHGEDVVSSLVPARGGWEGVEPFQRCAWRMKPGESRASLIDPDAGDLQRVHFIGSGVLMFPTHLLEKVEKPWFRETLAPDDDGYRRIPNQDCTFVWRLQTEAGAEVWCDTTIDVRHASVFEIDRTYTDRFSDHVAPGVGDPSIFKYQEKG